MSTNSIGGDRNHIAWSKRQHALITNGGAWGVPRSGLLFRRNDKGFELIMLMPSDDMPYTPDELWICQRQDYECIKRNMAEAGLEITDPKNLLNQ